MQQINVRSDIPSSITKMKTLMNDPDNTIIAAIVADWCGACQQFKPIWEATVKTYLSTQQGKNKNNKHKNKSKKIKKLVLATIQDSTIQEFNIDNIRGFPTIRVIKNKSTMNEHLGGMSEHTLMEYIKNVSKTCKNISPNSNKIKSKKPKNNKTTKKNNKPKKYRTKSSNNKKSKHNKTKKIKRNKSSRQKQGKQKQIKQKAGYKNKTKKHHTNKSKKTKTQKSKFNLKKGGYDNSFSRDEARRLQILERERREMEDLQRRQQEILRRQYEEKEEERKNKSYIRKANQMFPNNTYVYPIDIERAKNDIETHELHQRIMDESLPEAVEVPQGHAIVRPSRNLLNRIANYGPFRRMRDAITRRRTARPITSVVPIATSSSIRNVDI